MTTTTTTTAQPRRPPPRELAKALDGCRDLAIHRLQISLSAMLDRVGDMLMERASKSDIRAEQSLYLDTRGVLTTERATLMSAFEKRLRKRVNDRVSGRVEEEEFSKSTMEPSKLTLVDTMVMDEAVLTGNITRIVENACHEELTEFNRSVGYLMGKPDLETNGNPLAPQIIIAAFAEALKEIKADKAIKFQVLRALNQASLGDLASIYADMNRHLGNLRVVPAAVRAQPVPRGKYSGRGKTPAPADAQALAEVDMQTLFKRMFGGGAAAGMAQAGAAAAQPSMAHPVAGPDAPLPVIDAGGIPQAAGPMTMAQALGGHAPAGGGSMAFRPMAPTPSGYIPGAPIMVTPSLHEGITRLQAGQTGFDVDGASVGFSGIPEGLHNVLRDLQESPLGSRATQIESMTIEMVAMLFDFVFETRDLPDGIKALLARLQMPVLKAAMLDGAFFAKKQHPSRLLVNALAHAGLGWSTDSGQDDPLYKEIERIVHAVLDGFDNDLAIFDKQHDALKDFLAAEEAAAEANIASSAEEINLSDQKAMASAVARAEVDRRIEFSPLPNFLATFIRMRWVAALEQAHIKEGEDSELWGAAVATLEDLVWSVQPKRTNEDRKHLVAMLPSLLKRVEAGTHGHTWEAPERDQFMANLVEAHAAAVKPSLANAESPAAAVAEIAKVQAEAAKAAGDEQAAERAHALAEAMATAEPLPAPELPDVIDDDYIEIARNLDRGMWIEFENEDGQLAFAKLAWVSPLRGTYLFTNRQGQKALSMSAEELAERFRADTARLVEAEPLIDRALSSVMGKLEQQIAERAA